MAATKSTANSTGKPAASMEAVKQITYLASALKAPRIIEAAARLADQARDAGWTHEDYLAAVLEREVSARNASGAQLRIRAAGFGAVKTLEDFDFDAQSAVRQQVGALASGGFLTEARNVVLLGPPGTGKTHLATALGVAAARHGHRVLFATATDWVTRLTDAHRAGRLPQELARLRRYGLIIGRSRLPAVRAKRREPVLPARVLPLRTRLPDPDQQPAVLRLGRCLWRPGRRRHDDRPDRPPRRRPHPQRRKLPAPRERDRQPSQHPHHHRPGRDLDCRQPLTFQAPKPTRFRAPSTTDSWHVRAPRSLTCDYDGGAHRPWP